jgi:hypothetical protein
LIPKNCSKTWSAEGAATAPPKPPFSITAHTTSRGESNGPNPHHHEVSVFTAYPLLSACVSAVPVLPAICSGKLPNTVDEVPPGECVASSRPSRMTWIAAGSRLSSFTGAWKRRRTSGPCDGPFVGPLCSIADTRCGVTSFPPFASSA